MISVATIVTIVIICLLIYFLCLAIAAHQLAVDRLHTLSHKYDALVKSIQEQPSLSKDSFNINYDYEKKTADSQTAEMLATVTKSSRLPPYAPAAEEEEGKQMLEEAIYQPLPQEDRDW